MLVACPLKSVWSSLTDHLSAEKKNANHLLCPHGLLETLPKVCRNLGSLSDTIETDTPCNRTISQIYNWKNSSSMKVICTARKCADLVSRSTITHMASCLRCVHGKCQYIGVLILTSKQVTQLLSSGILTIKPCHDHFHI